MIIKEFTFEKVSKCESTQKLAHTKIEDGKCKHGEVFVCDLQTAGKGKYQREWLSPKGNIAFTFCLQVTDKHRWQTAEQICYIAGIAIYDTLCQLKPNLRKISLKWVNDLLIDNKKVAGILLEMVKDNWVLVGIGINTAPQESITNIGGISLLELGIEEDSMVITSQILNNLKGYYNNWLVKGFSKIKEEWLKRTQDLYNYVQIKEPDGRVLVGRFIGISDDGDLLLEVDKGIKEIRVGDLFKTS